MTVKVKPRVILSEAENPPKEKCHSERSEESQKVKTRNQTLRFTQGDSSNVILSEVKHLKKPKLATRPFVLLSVTV